MPKAGITVESCIIGEWLKQVGDPIKVGDILFTYETDKASFECESTAEGELLAIFFEEGEEVPCMENVCAVGPKGEPTDCLKPGAAPAAVEAAVEAAPVAAAEVAAPAAQIVPGAPVSPRAAKLAKAHGVDATQAVGTGPNGRIIERDVQKLIAEGAGAVALAAVMADKIPVEGKNVVCLVSGGNIDVNILSRVITRGLVTSGRNATLQIALEDKPGQLVDVATVIADCGANVTGVHYGHSDPNTAVTSCVLTLEIETRDFEQLEQVRETLRAQGFNLV
jgi:pyruvate/2-oxoglutarate dehydrogenase complex dihydrolipoamide acyltransferase (E2) component